MKVSAQKFGGTDKQEEGKVLRIRKFIAASAPLTVLGLLASAANAQLIGPTPYLSVADSPFFGDVGFTLEDFEDGLLNIPGVTASTGRVFGPDQFADSVDADDGVIDGLGQNGRSFFEDFGPTGITFTFNAAAFGGTLPTRAGIVWTDGTNLIEFEAFDQNGVSLGVIGGAHADATFFGTTAEDRFYGAANNGGISSIVIRSSIGDPSPAGIEVDHLQYSFSEAPPPSAAPEPGTLALLGTGIVGVAGMVLRKRRRS